jgi:carboxylesterase type B
MWDQIEALRWVRENISSFGGDPDNVTIAGQSAGSRSVVGLLASPATENLFAKAIALSGGAYSQTPPIASSLAERLVAALGLSEADAETLRALPVDRLVDCGVDLFASAGEDWPTEIPRRFEHVIDGELLVEDPLEAVREGRAHAVPAIFGSTLHEAGLTAIVDPSLGNARDEDIVDRLVATLRDRGLAETLFSAYREACASRGMSTSARDVYVVLDSDLQYGMPMRRLADAHSLHAPTYASLFAWESPTPGLGACHTIDLAFIFGTFGIDGMNEFSGSGADGDSLSRGIQDAICSFMRTGKPTAGGLPEWPEYREPERTTMILARTPSVEDSPLNAGRGAWPDSAQMPV